MDTNGLNNGLNIWTKNMYATARIIIIIYVQKKEKRQCIKNISHKIFPENKWFSSKRIFSQSISDTQSVLKA